MLLNVFRRLASQNILSEKLYSCPWFLNYWSKRLNTFFARKIEWKFELDTYRRINWKWLSLVEYRVK